MSQQFEPSSFIPKKPLLKEDYRERRGSAGISVIIGGILFVVSLGLAAGVYFYEEKVYQELETKKEILRNTQEAFDPDFIRELSRLSKRMAHAKSLLDSHLLFTPFFRHLEEKTLKAVRFESFEYRDTMSGPLVEVLLEGEAENFTSIALQADAFNESTLVQAPLFSDFDLTDDDRVSFEVRLLVQRELLSPKLTAQ